MTKYNQYPIMNLKGNDKSQNVKIESEAEINIETGDNKTDNTDKMYRIVLNLTESIGNDDSENNEEKEDVLRDFSIKIYYYLKSDNEKFSDEERDYITLNILEDLNRIVINQTSFDSSSNMNINKAIDNFKKDNDLRDKNLIEIIDKTKIDN